jgi:hypothetical protein
VVRARSRAGGARRAYALARVVAEAHERGHVLAADPRRRRHALVVRASREVLARLRAALHADPARVRSSSTPRSAETAGAVLRGGGS